MDKFTGEKYTKYMLKDGLSIQKITNARGEEVQITKDLLQKLTPVNN
jgi:hypothetical protein